MLPQQIAFMFSVIKPPADPEVVKRIKSFFEKDLHLKMEKADTDKDWCFLNKLADRGFLDAMKYHRKGVGDVIKLPFFDKWLIQYESAMNAFDMAQLRDEKYELYLKWSDLNDENKKLKEEIETLKKSNESYEDLLAGNKGLIDENKKLKAECNDKMTELARYKKNMRSVMNMMEYTIGGYDDVSNKINDILWSGAETDE
jgi:regulator of replication initiation timing